MCVAHLSTRDHIWQLPVKDMFWFNHNDNYLWPRKWSPNCGCPPRPYHPIIQQAWKSRRRLFCPEWCSSKQPIFFIIHFTIVGICSVTTMTFVWHSCCVCSAVSHVCVACMNCSLWSLTEHLMKIDKTIVKLLEEKLSVIQGAQVRPPSRREPTCLMMPMPMMMLLSRDVVEQPHSKGVNRSDMFWSQGSLSVTKQFCD